MLNVKPSPFITPNLEYERRKSYLKSNIGLYSALFCVKRIVCYFILYDLYSGPSIVLKNPNNHIPKKTSEKPRFLRLKIWILRFRTKTFFIKQTYELFKKKKNKKIKPSTIFLTRSGWQCSWLYRSYIQCSHT